MSLRTRLFLILGALVAMLVAAQWWWVRTLTRELSSEVHAVAHWVGTSVASVMQDVHVHREGFEGDLQTDDGRLHGRVQVWRFEEGSEGADRGADEEVRGSQDHPPNVVVLRERDSVPRAEGGDRDEVKAIFERIRILSHDTEDNRFLALQGPDVLRRIPIPQEGWRERLQEFSRRLLLGAGGLLVLGLLVAAGVAHRVASPLNRLATAARQVGEGALGAQVEAEAGGEVGRTLEAFNRMSTRLAELDAHNRELLAREHLSEIGEIARGLAHTLRNPLNALGLTVEELAAGTDTPAAGGHAEAARRQIQRIDRAIRSFLALASDGRGATAPVDVVELARDVALEVLQDARGRIRVEVDAGEGLPPLRAVEPELRAVIQALAVNAAEASPDGALVRIRLSPLDGDGIEVRVEDRGSGVPAEVRRRLFTPHLTTKADGSGMGLFLAQRITVSRYGGDLRLEDREGGGTRARLHLASRLAESDVDG